MFPDLTVYPPFCDGPGYAFTRDITEDIRHLAMVHPYFFVEDAYISGILRQKAVPEITIHDAKSGTIVHHPGI